MVAVRLETVVRKSNEYALIKVNNVYRMHYILDRNDFKRSQLFGLRSLVYALYYHRCGKPSFNNLCKIVVEQNLYDLSEVYDYAMENNIPLAVRPPYRKFDYDKPITEQHVKLFESNGKYFLKQ